MTPKHEALLSRIVDFAECAADVRGLALIGSSVATDKPNDEYSDIDLVLATDAPNPYYGGDEWAAAIGTVWTSFAESVPEARHRERRILFEGGIDVDFVIIDLRDLESEPESLFIAREICTKEMRVLVDKGGVGGRLAGLATDRREAAAPDERVYANLVGDYYFHLVWAAKKIARGEIWSAAQCVNGYLSQRLLTMIEWDERARRGNSYDTKHNGRYLEKWADPETVGNLGGVFSQYGADALRRALSSSEGLFSRLARETAMLRGFSFPEERARAVADYAARALMVPRVHRSGET